MSAKKESSVALRELSISRLINAPRELVWEAWTRPEHISQWWGPAGFKNTIGKMDVKPGGEWEFVMHGPDGTDYKNKHIYVSLDKPAAIVLDHISHPKFRMTATFEEQGNKTMVTLHSEFESADQLAEVIKVFKADEGMEQNIRRMDDYITTLNDPFIIERLLDAPADKVWHAISDRDAMKQWYFDLKVFRPEKGFTFAFTGNGTTGEEYIHHCRVTDVVPGEKLSYSWTYENRSGFSLVTFELFPEGNKTRIRLTHEGLASFRNNGPDFTKESFSKGWTELIGTLLKNFVEKN